MSKIVDLIRGFCENREEYKICENYSGRGTFGETCLGIVVGNGYPYMIMLMELTQYLDEHGYEDTDLNLEGISMDESGLDIIVYFPEIKG